MLNSGKIFRALRTKKNKYSNSCVVRKKNSERNKKSCKLNGRSLIHAFRMTSSSVLADIGCRRYSELSVNIHSLPLHSVCLVNL